MLKKCQKRDRIKNIIISVGLDMNREEMIRTKNKILVVALGASIILRCIVNGILLSFASIIPLGVAGLALTGVVALLAWKIKNPKVVMYMMVGVFSALSIMCMVAFPCTTNMLMFFLAVFMIVIYEEILPIVLQCIISAICIVIFYIRDVEVLQQWSRDVTVMSVVYIISGMFVFASMSYLSKRSFKNLEMVNEGSFQARKKAEGLLGEIGKTVGILGTTSGKIQESVTVTDEISKQIATAADDIAQRATEEVDAANAIRGKVQNGVEQINNIATASTNMTDASNATAQTVEQSAKHVQTLRNQMDSLNEKMDGITKAITQLTEENEHIIEILGTLDEITSQTNLLSLNASIEAARAGEQGKGFAVVATEIRNLSDSSRQFTEQIHNILDGVHEMTEDVKDEILDGQHALNDCNHYMSEVDKSFREIAKNTDNVLSQSKMIENRSQNLGQLLNETLTDATAITDNVASTSAAMEEISSSITELYSNIDNVVVGYNDINSITNSLTEISKS